MYSSSSVSRSVFQCYVHKKYSTCICSGCSHEFEVLNCTDGVTFKCTTDGGGATIFQGDGFSCKNELILLHSRFSSRNGTNLSCNNGSIVGMSLGVEGNCYISQLHIMTTFDLTGKAIECIHESYNTVAVHKLVGIYKGMN